MGRMTLSENEGLRLQGWRLFRSSSRDHVVPMSGPGQKLTRIRINEALPSSEVFTGVAATEEERRISAAARAQALAEARAQGEARPLGLTQYLFTDSRLVVGHSGGLTTETEIVLAGRAPFDGFISEFDMTATGDVSIAGLAFRSSGGASLFQTESNYVTAGVLGLYKPDFISAFHWQLLSGRVQLRNLKMPVFAGEDIFIVVLISPGALPGAQIGTFILGFEGYILARPGSAAAQSQFLSLAEDTRIVSRQLAADSARLLLQQQKDSAALERAKIDLEIAKLKSTGSPGPTGLRVPGFERVLNLETALDQLRSRAAPVPPPKPVPPPAPPEISGEGMTFVRSWMPSHGQIGYLIPDPPRGGKVTVFDSKYNIWDISGNNIGSGMIQAVNVADDIPAGARISTGLGGAPPKGLTAASGVGSRQF